MAKRMGEDFRDLEGPLHDLYRLFSTSQRITNFLLEETASPKVAAAVGELAVVGRIIDREFSALLKSYSAFGAQKGAAHV